jgi:hypothetical protein
MRRERADTPKGFGIQRDTQRACGRKQALDAGLCASKHGKEFAGLLLKICWASLNLLGFAIEIVLNQNRMTGGFFWVRCNEVARERYEG